MWTVRTVELAVESTCHHTTEPHFGLVVRETQSGFLFKVITALYALQRPTRVGSLSGPSVLTAGVPNDGENIVDNQLWKFRAVVTVNHVTHGKHFPTIKTTCCFRFQIYFILSFVEYACTYSMCQQKQWKVAAISSAGGGGGGVLQRPRGCWGDNAFLQAAPEVQSPAGWMLQSQASHWDFVLLLWWPGGRT